MKFTDEYLQFLYLEYVRIKKTKGVILTVPEHRLSFGLKMLDLINNKQVIILYYNQNYNYIYIPPKFLILLVLFGCEGEENYGLFG